MLTKNWKDNFMLFVKCEKRKEVKLNLVVFEL